MRLIVTGTGTGVGKTVVTAALAACASDEVAVVKPAQTGVRPGEDGDLAEVSRLSGIQDLHEFARYPDPLSPERAAARSGLPALALDDAVRRLRALDRELVLIEGAGGLLVRYADDGWTIADLACRLGASAVVVTTAALGTLNATALTLEAMATRGIELAGLVIGSWPAVPTSRAMQRGGPASGGRCPAFGCIARRSAANARLRWSCPSQPRAMVRRHIRKVGTRAVMYCDRCGKPGVHEVCVAARALEPPRYCPLCGRRMVVQITPGGWTARCVEHGERPSARPS
jgi:dethiobiotin synthetase